MLQHGAVANHNRKTLVKALITILLIMLFVAFILRHLGAYILFFLAQRMAKRFGAAPHNASGQRAQQRQREQPTPKQVIPDNVGEYIDFEEVK